jgi:hypothetical protein
MRNDALAHSGNPPARQLSRVGVFWSGFTIGFFSAFVFAGLALVILMNAWPVR